MGFELRPRLGLGRRDRAVQFALHGWIEPQPRQLAKQLRLALANPADPLCRARQPL